MIDLKTVTDLLSGVENKKHRTQVISNCPFCYKEGHFYMNKISFLFDCKKCGESGNIFKLLKQFDKLYLIEDGKTVELKLKKAGQEVEEEKIVEIKPIRLPVGFKRIYDDEYLRQRGLNETEFLKYKIGKTNLITKLKGYVLFVVEERQLPFGYVGRYVGKDKEAKRYENSSGTKFSELLFGYNEVTENTKKIILVEGLFDKIKIDKVFELDNSEETKCFATFGKKISDAQVRKIKKLTSVKEIVLCFDYDAIKEMKQFGFELKKNWRTRITYTTRKDVDECSDFEVVEIFKHHQSPQEFFMKNLIKV